MAVSRRSGDEIYPWLPNGDLRPKSEVRHLRLNVQKAANAVNPSNLSGRYFGLDLNDQVMLHLRCLSLRHGLSTSSIKPCPGRARAGNGPVEVRGNICRWRCNHLCRRLPRTAYSQCPSGRPRPSRRVSNHVPRLGELDCRAGNSSGAGGSRRRRAASRLRCSKVRGLCRHAETVMMEVLDLPTNF